MEVPIEYEYSFDGLLRLIKRYVFCKAKRLLSVTDRVIEVSRTIKHLALLEEVRI